MLNKYMRLRSAILLCLLWAMSSIQSYAQEKGIDIDVNIKKEPEWYEQTWVLVVGAALLVLIIVGFLRRRPKN